MNQPENRLTVNDAGVQVRLQQSTQRARASFAIRGKNTENITAVWWCVQGSLSSVYISLNVHDVMIPWNWVFNFLNIFFLNVLLDGCKYWMKCSKSNCRISHVYLIYKQCKWLWKDWIPALHTVKKKKLRHEVTYGQKVAEQNFSHFAQPLLFERRSPWWNSQHAGIWQLVIIWPYRLSFFFFREAKAADPNLWHT